MPLREALRDPRILAFLVVWFGLNALFGVGSVSLLGVDQPIAWQAHIGGSLPGFCFFRCSIPSPPPPGPKAAVNNLSIAVRELKTDVLRLARLQIVDDLIHGPPEHAGGSARSLG